MAWNIWGRKPRNPAKTGLRVEILSVRLRDDLPRIGPILEEDDIFPPIMPDPAKGMIMGGELFRVTEGVLSSQLARLQMVRDRQGVAELRLTMARFPVDTAYDLTEPMIRPALSLLCMGGWHAIADIQPSQDGNKIILAPSDQPRPRKATMEFTGRWTGDLRLLLH